MAKQLLCQISLFLITSKFSSFEPLRCYESFKFIYFQFKAQVYFSDPREIIVKLHPNPARGNLPQPLTKYRLALFTRNVRWLLQRVTKI